MSKKCPDKLQQPTYDKLVTLLNDDYPSAYRMWRKFEDSNPGRGAEEALAYFKRSTSDKINALKNATANLELDKTTHTYTWNGDPDISIRSLSDVVRGLGPAKETEESSVYAELGTKIHDVFSRIVNVKGDRTNANVNKDLDDLGIPTSMRNQLFDLYDEISKMGTVLSEQLVYAENTSEDVRIAGTADVIVYAPDGKKYIIDLKTVYVTSATRRAGRKPFDPLGYGQQKAKLYALQTMGYGRMTEFADGQPVSDHFIVPLEIEFNEDDKVESGFKSGKIVKEGSSHLTNIKSWPGMTDYATTQLDTIFGQSSQTITTNPIIGDDTSMVYANLTGDRSSVNKDSHAIATELFERSTSGTAPNRGFFINGKRIPFINQDKGTPEQIKAANIQQIEEQVNKTLVLNSDISHGIRGYLNAIKDGPDPDADKFLASFGRNSEHLKSILSPFAGRKDISVVNLSSIEGFADKKNWILVEDGKTRHLLYVGLENLNTRFDTKWGSTSLFGQHAPSLHTNTRYNGYLRNTLGAARNFEGSLIAIKIKEANPDVNFGVMAVYGLSGGNNYADMIDHKENLRVIQELKNDPILRDKVLAPNILKTISDENFLKYDNYRGDFMAMLTSYIDSRYSDITSKNGWDKIWANRKNYAKDAMHRKAMLDAVRDFLNEHLAIGRTPNTNYETMLLAQFYLQLQDLDVSLLPTDVYRKLGGIQSNIANPMLQKLNAYLNNSVNTLSKRFWKEYKDPFRKALDSFLKTRGIGDRGLDRVVGNTPRHYIDLYKKHTYKVAGTDKTIEVPNMEFVDEGSDAFKALSPEAQALIRTTNDLIQDMAKKAGLDWQRGRLPLVRASMENRIANIMRTGGANAYSEFVRRAMLNLEDSFGTGDDASPEANNIFGAQANSDLKDPRLPLMGVMADNNLDTEAYYNWTTNLETMMDVFAIQELRVSSFNEIGASMKAANSVLQWWKSNLLTERFDGTIDWVKYANSINIENHDLDTGTQLNKATRLVQKAAAIGLYAFNPVTAVTAQIGNELTLTSESIANWLSKTNRFKLGTVAKAKAIIGSAVSTKAFDSKNYNKIDLLMREFRMFNQDLSSFLNGYHRYGDKTIFRSKFMFSMLNGGDWATRANVMVAQMLEDGSWDAFSVNADGELTYDESKDERFNGKGKLSLEEGRALRSAILAENGQEPGEKLKFGYTDQHGNSMRALSNYLFGATDRESRSMMNYLWWGKLLGGSKNWFVAKYDRYVLGVSALGGGKSFTSEQIGEYVFETDPDTGEQVAIWKGEHIEGILMSLMAGIEYIKSAKDQRKPLTSIQKNNIIRFSSDMALIAFMTMLASAITDDDKDTILDDTLSLMLRRSTDDLLVFYNAITLDDFLWTPIALSWGHQAMTRFFKAATSMDPDDMLKATPIANQLPRVYDMVNTSKFEITTEDQ